MSYLAVFLDFVFVDNLVLVLLLGLYPAVRVPRRREAVLSFAVAITILTALAASAAWIVQRVILVPLGITYLQTAAFVLVAAGIGQLLHSIGRRAIPSLGRLLGGRLPVLTANCAVLGIAFIAVHADYDILESLIAGIAAGGGYLLVLYLMSTLRERLESEWVPRPFRGLPILFITAGLLAIAFMAFDKVLIKGLLG